MRMTQALVSSLQRALPVAAVAALVASSAQAAIPPFSAVEGVLSASGGTPAADGVYAVTFGLYKEETGGNPLWVEGPVNIGVKGGQWTHQLGSAKPLGATVLNGANLWLGMQIGSDAELPRRQLSTAVFAVRAAVADALECSGCVGAGALDPKAIEGLVKKSELAAVALSGNFSDLKGGPDLSAYVKASALAAVATSGEFKDLKGGPDLSAYVKAASLATVAGSGSYNDLKDKPTISDAGASGNYGDLLNKPVLAQVGKSCGTNLVVAGIKADGSLECATSAIAPDMIDEISNGLIWNQFVDSTAGGQGVDILDGNGAGKSDSLAFPDIGTAQAIWVDVDLTNSQISDLTIELYGPGMGNPYVLHAKSGSGQTIKTAYNKSTPLAQGDMNKDWVGKNPKGTWSLTVKDPNDNQLNQPLDGKFSWSLSIQTLSTKKIQVKGNVIIDGTTTVGGGLKIGNTTATCDASTEGTIRNEPTMGMQVCQKNWNNSNKVDGYTWVQQRNAPIVWSGGCTSHQGGGPGWLKYCLNGTDFNTAKDYLTVDSGGDVTVKVSGWYRLTTWAIQHGCDHKHVQVIINGTSRAYAHMENDNHAWHNQNHDLLWPFRKGDTFHHTYYAAGCNGYPYHSWNANGHHSRHQFEYVGPLQEGYVVP